MDDITRASLDGLQSKDKDLQNKAFLHLLDVTEKPVNWAYEVWDELVERLSHKDNRQRAISAQILCNLAKSDPQNRMLKDLMLFWQLRRMKGSLLPDIVCKLYGKLA
jgi:hypothetical protein